MKTIDEAIDVLVDMVTTSIKGDEALRFTQAALNLAHVKGLLKAIEKDRTTKTVKKPTQGAG